jgi:hypothetical protein
MVADWVEAKELTIQGMRQPGQGMPVSITKGRERPLHGVPRRTGQDMVILLNIRQVIEIDEVVMDYGIVESERRCCQQEAENDNALL